MPAAANPGGFARWVAPGRPNRIEYSIDVLRKIREQAEAGYYRLARGGLEIGGVLFGAREGAEVRISAFRPVECDYALGPGFRLSPAGFETFQETLNSAANDPELAGLEPVGWYHSHTRSGISLTDEDIEVSNRFFPQPGQIALVLRPDHFAPTRAGFFFRGEDGAIDGSASLQEFDLAPPPRTRRRAPEREAEAAGNAVPAPALEPPAAPLSPLASGAEPPVRFLPARHTLEDPSGWQPPHRASGRAAKWISLSVVLLGLLAAGIMGARQWLSGAAPQPLSVQLKDVDGQLHIDWDREAAPVVLGTRAVVRISDGSETTSLELDAPRLRQGRVVYARQTGNVEVQMRVSQGERVIAEEFAHFVAAGAGRPDNGKPGTDRRPELERQIESMRAQIERQSDEIRRLKAPPAGNVGGAQPPAYSGPRSGRLIWTGNLKPGGTVSIYGSHASSGHLIGELPGAPVRIRVSQAETAGSLAVLENPGPRNAWRAVTLGSRGRAVATFVLSWEVVSDR